MLLAALEDIQVIDWVICAAYLALVIALGVYFSGTADSNDEFFHGGKAMHWLPVGLSLFATTFSSNSFVGLPSEGAFGDYHQLLAIFFIPFVVIPITCKWFIPKYKSWNYNSLYEYFEKRFDRKLRLLASSVFMFYSAGWMATMLLAVARVLGEVLETTAPENGAVIIGVVGILATIYTAMGGVKAVIWTDTVQAFALGGGMLLLLVSLIGDINGGWNTFWIVADQADKMEMTSTAGGWGERNVFSAIAYGFFIYMGGQVATYGAYQRYITVDSIKDAQASLIVKGVFTLLSCTLFFVVGTALYVFYQQTPGDAEIFVDYSQGAAKDRLLPHYVMNSLDAAGITGLLLAGLFAAAMSSLDSGINSMVATYVTDWHNGKDMGKGTNRRLTLFFGTIVTGIGCVMSFSDLPVFDLLLSVGGATLGLLLSILIVGLLYRKATTIGVISGMVAGLAVYAYIRIYIGEFADAEALASLDFRLHPYLHPLGNFGEIRLNTWWDGMFTTCTSLIVAVGVSRITYCGEVVDPSLIFHSQLSRQGK